LNEYSSWVPLLAVLVSLVATVFIALFSRRPNLRESVTLLAAVAKFALVVSLLGPVLEGRVPTTRLLEITQGVDLALRADAAGLFFAVVSSGLWIVTSVYSVGYMRRAAGPAGPEDRAAGRPGPPERGQTRYYGAFAVSLSATIGIAFAANLLTLVIFYELLTLATYPLVVHKQTPEAISGGRRYLAYALTGGLAMLAAAGWTYMTSGPADFTAGGFLGGEVGRGEAAALFALFIVAAGVKSAVMPLHSWLPAAMVAPTPVSALLHAVAVVKAGVFAFVRIVGFVFGPELLRDIGAWDWLAALAGFTLLFGSLLAFTEDNLKRRLAYSTIGHLAYVVLGVALITPAAIAGGLLHIATHAAMKITLFFCAGAIYIHTRRDTVSSMNGLGRRMPITFGAFAIGALGLAGVPPVGGFASKWLLSLGALEAERWPYLLLLMVSGLLNAGYLLPVVWRGFFLPPEDGRPSRFDEATPWMVAPLAFTALLALYLGLQPNGVIDFYDLAVAVAESVIGEGGQALGAGGGLLESAASGIGEGAGGPP
jgi:multicomponent Na+:H+ antiporter subunit D